MSTPRTLIQDSRYDLRDKNGTVDENELLSYLNRIVRQLDMALWSIDSDLVKTYTDVTLSTGEQSASTPTGLIDVIDIYIGTTWLEKTGWDYIRYKQRHNSSSTGQPYLWCLQGQTIQVEIPADDDYTLTVDYAKRTGTLTLDSTLPYDEMFDDAIRQAVVLMRKGANEENPIVDSALFDFFTSNANGVVIARNFVPDYHVLDF